MLAQFIPRQHTSHSRPLQVRACSTALHDTVLGHELRTLLPGQVGVPSARWTVCALGTHRSIRAGYIASLTGESCQLWLHEMFAICLFEEAVRSTSALAATPPRWPSAAALAPL